VVVIGGELDVHRGAPSRLTLPVNEARLPAVTFPVGTSEDGLPLGAQVIGPPFSDERLLAVVAAFQEAA
jgi:Asp-tRNA(Asn)/Glu-tRNA(Gln) amidotransferase A subunit family amidase